jgi:glutamate-1-semialdehyde 2,1-aminomutase
VHGQRSGADLLGKIIGGGLPVGAYGGRADLMAHIAPEGPVYQAGTLSGNPLAMAAGLATLRALRARPNVYDELEGLGASLQEGVEAAIARTGAPCRLARAGSMWTLFFTPAPVTDWESAAASDTGRYARFFHAMLGAGHVLAPAQFEANFISAAHTPTDVAATVEACAAALAHGL